MGERLKRGSPFAVFTFIILGFQIPANSQQIPIEPDDDVSLVRLENSYFKHDVAVVAAAIPRDSKLMISLDSSGMIYGWDCAAGRRRYSRPAVRPKDPPQSIVCSSDGRFVALSSRRLPPSTIRVLDLASGEEIRRFDGGFSPTFSPDGEVLAASDGKNLRRWAVKSGAELPSLEPADADLSWVLFSPDGKALAAAYQRTMGYALWDTGNRRITVQTEPTVDWPPATSLAYAPEGDRLVIGNLWGVGNGSSAASDPELLGGPPLQYSPDGRWLICGSRRKLLDLWDRNDGALVYSVRIPFSSPEFLEVSQGGDLIMRIRGVGIHLEKLPTSLDLPGGNRAVVRVGFTAQGRAIIADSTGAIRYWDLVRMKESSGIWLPGVNSFSRDADKAVLVRGDDRIQVWDLEAGRELLKVEGVRRPSAWALSPDGASLALGTLDGEVSLWDVPGRKRRSRVQSEVGVTALVWSPNGKTIAWGDALGCVVFAEGETGHEPLHFEARGQGITVLAFLPDGKSVVSGDTRGQIRLWREELGTEPVLLASESGPVTAVACSPDARWVVGASGITLRLYSLSGRESDVTLRGHRKSIHSIAFSSDGTRLVSGGEDPAAILWRVPGGK